MSYAERDGVVRESLGQKLVYVAGPYNAPTPREIELNIRRAEDLALQVAHLGAAPLVSHPMTRFLFGVLPETFWRAAVMLMLERCDAVVLVDGWQQSEGSRLEVNRAIDLGIPVFTTIAGLQNWIDGQRTIQAPGSRAVA